jgi:glyoxylase-like metal-dependent hydrolase (beta-lactamase superfamily II)
VAVAEWFRTFKVAPGVHRIEEGGHVNAYLVEGQELAALIDSGIGIGDISLQVKQLSELPIIVVNTHAHLDHVGGNRRFVTTALHRAENLDLELVTILRFRKMVTQADFSVPFPDGFCASEFDPRVPQPTHLIQGGEVIDLGGRVLEVLHTPGHTPGSICLLDDANRLLFCGDTVSSRALHGTPESVGMSTYAATLQTLAQLAPDTDLVLSGHGESPLPGAVLSEVAAAADEAARRAGDFQEMQLGFRAVRGLQVGRFTFFVRPDDA